jgi:hypothetical protein
MADALKVKKPSIHVTALLMQIGGADWVLSTILEEKTINKSYGCSIIFPKHLFK